VDGWLVGGRSLSLSLSLVTGALGICPPQGSIEMEVLLSSTGFNVLPLKRKDRALSGNTIDTLTTHTQNHLTSKMSPVGLVLFLKNSSVD
jgi:hypothetical protein